MLEFHPDINHSPEAVDLFIAVSEAYDFLISNYDRTLKDQEEFDKAMDDWRKYRQDRSQHRSADSTYTSYAHIRNAGIYKSSRIYDAATIVFSFLVSIIVLTYTISGYIYRLNNPIAGLEKHAVLSFILLLMLGMTFFVISLIYFLAYLEVSAKRRKKRSNTA